MYDLILKNVARFIQLNPDEIQLFTSMLRVKRIKKRQYLIQEGDVSRYEYFVNSGCLRTFLIDPKGVEHNVQFAIEDWWTGDMYSFLTQTPARYNIVAIEDAELLAIDKNSLEDLYIKVPKFERFFRNLLQNAFISMQQRILANMSETAEERYQHFRVKYPEMDRRIPQKEVASYLGITPESLSRVRRQMTERKL